MLQLVVPISGALWHCRPKARRARPVQVEPVVTELRLVDQAVVVTGAAGEMRRLVRALLGPGATVVGFHLEPTVAVRRRTRW
jgi:hypothetical protein